MHFNLNGYKIARLKAGLTQSQVAKAINVRPETITQWERGSNVPNRNNRAKLAELYKVSIEELEEK